jgi:LacI family transcriptional regulator
MSVMEVAQLAGVSQATVSKVLNNYPSVSREKARLVRDAMKQLNYVPTSRRRGKSLKHGLVAILFLNGSPDRDFNANFATQLVGIERALRSHGSDMMLATVATPADLPGFVRNRRVDGLVLIGHKPSQAVLDQIKDIPSVWLTSHQEPSGDVMLVGNEDVGRLAAEYLIDRGHKHLGIINAQYANPALDKRFNYFTFIAEQRQCRVSQFVSADMAKRGKRDELDLLSLERRLDEQVGLMLAEKDMPTGLFVPYDLQVAVLYRVLNKRGVAIDRNLEIIGDTDEKVVLAGLSPRPATINTAPDVMGQHAIEQLILRLNNGETGRQVRVAIEPKLVPGDHPPVTPADSGQAG